MREVVALIPAAGTASRLAPLPCSKELYPVGFRSVENSSNIRPKVVSHYLLENMRSANIKKAFIIIRDGKWDIPSYFGDGKLLDMYISYLMMNLPYGVPYTLDQAYTFIGDSIVALGFPDIIFRPENAYTHIIAKQKESNADIVLGLFPTDRPHKNDMVELDNNGIITGLNIKPSQTRLKYTWQIAVWTPAFSHYMHEYLADIPGNSLDAGQKELFVGDIIHAAIKDRITFDYILFKNGTCLDIGTPGDLMTAILRESEIY